MSALMIVQKAEEYELSTAVRIVLPLRTSSLRFSKYTMDESSETPTDTMMPTMPDERERQVLAYSPRNAMIVHSTDARHRQRTRSSRPRAGGSRAACRQSDQRRCRRRRRSDPRRAHPRRAWPTPSGPVCGSRVRGSEPNRSAVARSFAVASSNEPLIWIWSRLNVASLMLGADCTIAVEHDRQLPGRAGRRRRVLHSRGGLVELVDAVGAGLEDRLAPPTGRPGRRGRRWRPRWPCRSAGSGRAGSG